MEPYPTPNIVQQDLAAVLEAVAFVDGLWFGGWNYNSLATAFPDREGFYGEAWDLVKRFCAARGIDLRSGD
jgi:hypothetical protein